MRPVRIVGIFLLVVGLVAAGGGFFFGCGGLFAWNGRHPVDVRALAEGDSRQTLVPEAGRKYTVAVQIVFEREGREEHEGALLVDARFPLTVRVRDKQSTVLAEAVGWFDPNEAPTVLYGQAIRPGRPPELSAERLIGPFIASSEGSLEIAVTLGPDRVGAVPVRERRLVIYDDSIPSSVKGAFAGATTGIVGVIAGSVTLAIDIFRRRARRRRRVAA